MEMKTTQLGRILLVTINESTNLVGEDSEKEVEAQSYGRVVRFGSGRAALVITIRDEEDWHHFLRFPHNKKHCRAFKMANIKNANIVLPLLQKTKEKYQKTITRKDNNLTGRLM